MHAEDSDTAQPTPEPSEGKQETPSQIACDVCYMRKIRCDRKSPCSNCIDSKVSCARERQKSGRRARDVLPKEISDALREIQSRMATIESSVGYLVTASSNAESKTLKDDSRKRSHIEAFGARIPQSNSSAGPPSPFIAVSCDAQLTPPFSASEAQSLIQQELNRVPNSDKAKQVALNSALQRLKQSLNTSIINKCIENRSNTAPALEDMATPPVSLIQWMLRSKDTGRAVCSGDFMPFTSRRTIARMAQELMRGKPTEECDLASLICVTTYAFYFVQEIVLADYREPTGLEDHLRTQAEEFFATGRAASSWFRINPASNLSNLQALTYGVNLAQEAGDFVAAWLLTEATSKMCIALNLHKKKHEFTDGSPEIAYEAYYCFSINYKNDKGLAMNLGRPAFLDDSTIEIDLLQPPNSTTEVLDNFRVYLELAKVQSRIITELRPAKRKKQRANIMTSILGKMDDIWELIKRTRQKDGNDVDRRHNSDMDSILVDFAFYSVQTVIYHSGNDRQPASLNAARAALNAVQEAREMSRLPQYNSTYMQCSFAHWTILHYPFTPFFVLLCNVISTQHLPDFHIIQQFVDYLAETQELSLSIAKLYKLCIPFCSLATGVLTADENGPTIEQQQQPAICDDQQPQPLPSNQLDVWQQDAVNFSTGEGHQMMQCSMGNFVPYDGDMNTSVPQEFIQDPNTNFLYEFAGEFMRDFTGTQPVLQWLDSNFTGLDDVWFGNGNSFSFS